MLQNKFTDLETWCWEKKLRTPLSNDELFSLAQSISGKQEMDKKELEEKLAKSRSKHSQELPQELESRINKHFEERVKDIMEKNSGGRSNGGQGKGKRAMEEEGEGTHGRGRGARQVEVMIKIKTPCFGMLL